MSPYWNSPAISVVGFWRPRSRREWSASGVTFSDKWSLHIKQIIDSGNDAKRYSDFIHLSMLSLFMKKRSRVSRNCWKVGQKVPSIYGRTQSCPYLIRESV
jgi:hypothetical protein